MRRRQTSKDAKNKICGLRDKEMKVFQKMGVPCARPLRKEVTQCVLWTKGILDKVTAKSLYFILCMIKSYIRILYLFKTMLSAVKKMGSEEGLIDL